MKIRFYISHFQPACRRRGFSLIELLTVIAIIAILAAILIPTVSKVRAMAQTAGCTSNMRQIGLAVLMYTTEHNGMLPGPLNAYQTGHYKGTGSAELVSFIWPYLSEKEWVAGTSLRAQNFICPAWTAANGKALGACYHMNMAVYLDDNTYFEPFGRAASGRQPHNIDELTGKRSEMFILYEVDNLNAPGVAKFDPVHGKFRNKVFFDGHVASEDITELRQ